MRFVNQTCSLTHSMLYKASLDSGRLLQKWNMEMEIVTPVYKGGDAESVNNYRPISLTRIPLIKSWTMYSTIANTVLGEDCLAKPNCMTHIM